MFLEKPRFPFLFVFCLNLDLFGRTFVFVWTEYCEYLFLEKTALAVIGWEHILGLALHKAANADDDQWETKYLFECFRIMIFFVSKKYQEMGWWRLVEHNRGKSRLNFNQIDTARRGSGQNNPFKLCQSIFLNSTLLTRQYFKSKIFYFKFNSIGRQMTQNLTFVIWTKIF